MLEGILRTTWPKKFQTVAVKAGKGPNKTLNSISKVCKATTGIHQIVEEFDSSVGIHKTSVQHATYNTWLP